MRNDNKGPVTEDLLIHLRGPASSGNGTLDLRRYEAILRASWDAIVSDGADGTIRTWTPAAEQLYGYTAAEMIGQQITILEPDDRKGEAGEVLARADHAPVEYLETVRRHKDGTLIPVALSIARLIDEKGVLIGASTITHDLSDDALGWQRLREEQRRSAEALGLLNNLYSVAPIGLGFIDRDFRIIRVNDALARVAGIPVAEQIGRRLSDVLPDIWLRIETALRRVLETGQAVLNLEVDGPVAGDPGRTHHWLTSYYPVRLYSEILGIGVVAVDVTDRKESERELAEVIRSAVGAIAATVEARDPCTAGHMQRVADLSAAIATKLGMEAKLVDGVKLAASIHDIGKIGVPMEILSSVLPLTAIELTVIKEHPRSGHNIIAGMHFMWPIAQMIEQHHERCDGSGYPNGLNQEQILLGARIIGVADVMDAMSSRRPYRPSQGIVSALREIEKGRATLFDASVVDACLTLFTDKWFEQHAWN